MLAVFLYGVLALLARAAFVKSWAAVLYFVRAPVAQLYRVRASEARGRRLESRRAHCQLVFGLRVLVLENAKTLALRPKAIFLMLIVNRQNAAILRTPHGSEIRPLIDGTTAPIELCSLAEEVLPPGATVARHHHLATEEVYYILHGTGQMTVGEETRAVGPGDAIYIPLNHIHTLTNTGAEPLTLLLVCGPAYSRADHLMEID